jgi:pyrroloquinoline quinone biosynthesis protein E
LTTEEWQRVLEEAAKLGALHVGFSGGEPLARQDLAMLVKRARSAGLYTNLITSGIGLNESRATELREAGLDSVQLSLQSDEVAVADAIAGTRAHERKINAAEAIKGAGLPLSLNVVLHRANIDRLLEIIALAEFIGAERIELANTQYYGWAFTNRATLLPTRAQTERAKEIALEAKARLAGRMEVFYVLADYYESRPKPCLMGWGRRYITVNPTGEVLPCPTAFSISGMRFESVRERSLDWIWAESESFNRFRGTDWMSEPCRSCPERELDFGGCRCQSALVLGDAGLTDPVCALSPRREVIDLLIDSACPEVGVAPSSYVYRQNPVLR